MTTRDLLFDGPADAPLTLTLIHGAGAPLDSPYMAVMARGAAVRGPRVPRFEISDMAARRVDGGKRPPDHEPVPLDLWRRTIEALGAVPLAISGFLFALA